MATRSKKLIRSLVRELQAYVPGEQPKIMGLVKLNTNENPYPPSPKVLSAVRAATDGRLRLYPNPTAQGLRERLAKLHGCAPENLIVGNGSDELLALATRAFVEPTGPGASKVVQYFTPSYSLYPVLADIHGAERNPVALRADFSLPTVRELKGDGAENDRPRYAPSSHPLIRPPGTFSPTGGEGRDEGGQVGWKFDAALTFVTTPNAPSGRGYATAELDALCRAQRGVVVLDEAYVDFAGENALELVLQHPHVLVARTFSKAYSLCFQRVGYFIGDAALIAALQKIRDSYNVNGLGQIAAQATLDDLPYYRANFRRIIATRERVGRGLSAMGFEVLPSATNFILVRPPGAAAEVWLEKLRARKILVRWFSDPAVRDYLRISIGTDAEADALLRAAAMVSAKR